jgi:DNA-binding CsgD family transcriptional regulator
VRSLVPDAVIRSTAARLEQLGADAAALARAVSILGDDCQLHVAAAVAEVASGVVAADVLTTNGIVVPARPLRFQHPLLLAAVRDSIPGPERSALHSRAARVLHTEPGGLDLACAHLLEVDPSGDPSIVELLRRGAADATRRGLPVTTVTYLRRALAEPPSPDVEPTVLIDLAAAAYVAQSPDALELGRIAVERATDADSAASAAISSGHIMTLQGRADEAIELLSAALERPGAPPELVDLGMALAVTWSMATIHTRRTTSAFVARARQRAMAPDAPPMLRSGAALDAAVRHGTAAEIVQIAKQSWADGQLVREAPPGGPFPHSAIIAAAVAGEISLVDRWNERCMDLAAARGDVVGRGVGAMWQSLVREATGDPTAAIAYAMEALDHGWDTLGMLLHWGVSLFGEASLLTEGTAAAARALELLPVIARDPQFMTAPIWYLSRARLALAEHRLDDALADVGEVETWERLCPAPGGGWAMWHPVAAEIHLALGEGDRANGLAQMGVQRATTFGAPRPLARALRVAGLTLPIESRAGLLEESLAVAARGSCGLDGALVRLDLARALAATGDETGAVEHLQTALDDADRSGAVALAGRAVEVSGELGVVVVGPTTRSGILDLSPAERRVVDLAVAAQSNRAIAEVLFVSEKTVESHLTAAYRKLGIRGRKDLAAAVKDALA